MITNTPYNGYYGRQDEENYVRDNPQEIADYLIDEHGLDEALSVVDEGKKTANNVGDLYALSIWREVKVILRDRGAGDRGAGDQGPGTRRPGTGDRGPGDHGDMTLVS